MKIVCIKYLTLPKWGKRTKLLPAMVLAAVMALASFNRASAQINNASDWNVPPPLPPGSVTKGVTTGKAATVVLSLVDISAGSLPAVRLAQIPGLAPVATTSPAVNTPEQPAEPAIISTGIPEIPHPGAPDAPPLPKQVMADVQIPLATDLPFTAAPEMPPLPPEPSVIGQSVVTVKRSVPLLPGMVSAPTPILPAGKNIVIWPTPAIVGSGSIKPTAPGGKKN